MSRYPTIEVESQCMRGAANYKKDDTQSGYSWNPTHRRLLFRSALLGNYEVGLVKRALDEFVRFEIGMFGL